MKTIVYISRTHIEAATTTGGRSPKITSRFRIDLHDSELSDALIQIVQKIRANKIFLVLGKDISYYIETSFLLNKISGPLREYIYAYVQYSIPDELEDSQWDFKEISRDKKQVNVLIFAPVKDIFQKISDTLRSNNIAIEAIEPEQLAISRNPDPLLGIARKDDIHTKDERSLNIALFDPLTTSDEKKNEFHDKTDNVLQDNPQLHQQPAIRKEFFFAFIITLIIGGIIILSLLVARSQKKVIRNSEKPSITITPTVMPTLTPVLSLSNYSILIENGSGISGQAKYVEDILKEAGFSKIDTKNADSYDFTDTIIQVKNSTASAYIINKISEILDEYNVKNTDPLKDDQTYDVLLIVGQKKL